MSRDQETRRNNKYWYLLSKQSFVCCLYALHHVLSRRMWRSFGMKENRLEWKTSFQNNDGSFSEEQMNKFVLKCQYYHLGAKPFWLPSASLFLRKMTITAKTNQNTDPTPDFTIANQTTVSSHNVNLTPQTPLPWRCQMLLYSQTHTCCNDSHFITDTHLFIFGCG